MSVITPFKKPSAGDKRVIVALDNTLDEALALIPKIAGTAAGVKIGYRHISSGGVVPLEAAARENGVRVFRDGKFLDIPDIVAAAVRELNTLNIAMCNLHIRGAGDDMIKKAVAAATEKAENRLCLIGVTVLTSQTYADLVKARVFEPCEDEAEQKSRMREYVVSLASDGKSLGLDGVVASAQEAKDIRSACGEEFIIVTPAISPGGKARDDQKRVATARQAILDGTDYPVVGRPIYAQPDPVEALAALNQEIDQAIADKTVGATE